LWRHMRLMKRTTLIFVFLFLGLVAAAGALLAQLDHSKDHNVPGASTGPGRSSLLSSDK
jgi:hypothetical protein